MTSLDSLKNSSRPYRTRKRVGRGIGSGVGKTCGRGEKGAGARAGYKRRFGKEGGQFPLFMKTPIRGFNNSQFRKFYHTVNLSQIDNMFKDGETVSFETLKAKGFFNGRGDRLKILGDGELKKKVKIEAHAMTASAREKLQHAKIEISLIESNQ